MEWFGPSLKEIWEQASKDFGGELVENAWWQGPVVKRIVGPWTIVMDLYDGDDDNTYTRLRVPFLNPAGFRFKISREGPFGTVGKLLGMQDIEVGDLQFDKTFLIKSNDENTVRELLANPTIRQLILARPGLRIEIKDNDGWLATKFPDDVDELQLLAPGKIEEAYILESLFELFAALLKQLCLIKVTPRQEPGVRL